MVSLLYAALSCVFLLSVTVKTDSPLYWDSEMDEPLELLSSGRENSYRLPENVKPLEYDVDIEMYFDDVNGKQAFTYDGVVSIVIEAVEQNVRQIVLHANVDEIEYVTLTNDDGHVEVNHIVEPQYHFLRINLSEDLVVGRTYTLVISYSSTMNETPLTRGIWRGWYTDENGNERIYATTHFQPYNARQAFPCWDEPQFKAVFTLHITRPSRYSKVFSNTGIETSEQLTGERVKDNFRPTPIMSTYLVTFLVSETFIVIAENTNFTPPIRIIARSNAMGLGAHALNLAVKMTQHFDEYFGIPYVDLHPNLYNDHISSPDWASAATENWGMVSYREMYVIMDQSETIMSVEHYAATLFTHELAHKWFGNLVTCFWWSNTWINEGFASYFGYIATNEVFPEYDLHEHFNSRYLQTSLSTDSNVNTVPLNYEVNTPAQVTGHFGTISYSKGASFLRMLSDMITPATFRKACQLFLENNKYEAVNQYDLYEAFSEAVQEDGTLQEYLNFNFTDYYFTWVNEPGYPILNVEIDRVAGEMRLSQERFFLTQPSTDQIYPIPITYSTQSNPFFNVKPSYMMTTDRIVLTENVQDEWVIFNNLQHGHYRVNYDDRSWEIIVNALSENLDNIHYMNRAQIVDDVFALMRSERMTYVFGFNILSFLSREDNYHVWNPAISGFTWLRNRLRHLPNMQAALDELILSRMEHVIQILTYNVIDNETPTVSLTRQEVLHFACTLGHQGCVQDARAKFAALRGNTWINPKIRRHVYVVGIREGNQADYQFLLYRFRNSNFANDQLEMLRALAATKDETTLIQYMDMTLTKEVRPHDKINSFTYALLGNPENADIILEYVIDHIEDIRNSYIVEAPNRPVHSCLSNLAGYLNENGLAKMEEWLESTQQSSLEYSTAINAVRSARSNIAWGTEHAEEIMRGVRGGAVQAVASLTLIMLLATLSIYS